MIGAAIPKPERGLTPPPEFPEASHVIGINAGNWSPNTTSATATAKSSR